MLPMFRTLGAVPGGRSKTPYTTAISSATHLVTDAANIVCDYLSIEWLVDCTRQVRCEEFVRE